MLAGALLFLLFQACTLAANSDATCDSSMTDASYLPSVTCSRDHVSQSLSSLAPCQPRDKVVKIPWPSNSSYDQLTPSHVTVKRCSGGCHGGLTSCVPTSTQLRKVSVLLARCPLGGGSCQKECATLEVEDELACGCGCRLEPSSCRSEDQEWREETCSCHCRDTAATTTCLQGGRAWDHQSCQCLCPPSDPCPEDHTHDPVTCTCVAPAVYPQQREEREEKQEEELHLNWEHPVILTLASLNVLLILIIVLLVRRHRQMARKVKEQPKLISGEVSKNLYSTAPRNNSEASTVKAPLLYTSDSDVSSVQLQNNTDSSCSSELSEMTSSYRPSPQPTFNSPLARVPTHSHQTSSNSENLLHHPSHLPVHSATTGHSPSSHLLTYNPTMEQPALVVPCMSSREALKPCNCSYTSLEASSPLPPPPPPQIEYRATPANSITLVRRGLPQQGLTGRETPL